MRLRWVVGEEFVTQREREWKRKRERERERKREVK